MDKVLILMSTYNGEKYLEEMLLSLTKQEKCVIYMLVRDDGSSDTTLDILNKYKNRLNISITLGKNIGASQSYKYLVGNAKGYDFYFFADQDDYWLENKIVNSTNSLKKNNEPTLYYSSAIVTDENLHKIKVTNKNERVDFKNYFLGSHAIGCTMAFNNKFLMILKSSYPKFNILHDAWAIRVASITESKIIFDSSSNILYRQHSQNVIGVNSSLERYKSAYRNSLKYKNIKSKLAKEILTRLNDKIILNYRKDLTILANYKFNLRYRLYIVFARKFRKDSFFATLLFKFSVLFGFF